MRSGACYTGGLVAPAGNKVSGSLRDVKHLSFPLYSALFFIVAGGIS